MSGVWELSLVSGPVPWVITGLGGAGLMWLGLLRRRRFVRRAVPACVGLAGCAAVASWAVLEKWWRPFPDALPPVVYVWIGVAACGLLLAAARAVAAAWWARAMSAAAAVMVTAAAGVQVNLVFGAYPTVEDVVGWAEDTEMIPASAVPATQGSVIAGRPLESLWRAPATMASSGKVVRAPIPGVRSGFRARAAEIYLPPAYFTAPRPVLPVLVLLAGQPGSPVDWFKGGRLSATMDSFATAHAGLAPVVVVADATGSPLRNPLCLDSRLGKVATYLAVDVPDWVRGRFQVDPAPRSWAIGGLSYGGTCALQMATNYPQVYPTFLDLSGDPEPSLGDRIRTVEAAFGGDTAAFDRVSPLTLLRTRRYPGSAGALVTGTDDRTVLATQRAVATAARTAGMEVTVRDLPGGHEWSVWSAGLRLELDWLARRLGLTR